MFGEKKLKKKCLICIKNLSYKNCVYFTQNIFWFVLRTFTFFFRKKNYRFFLLEIFSYDNARQNNNCRLINSTPKSFVCVSKILLKINYTYTVCGNQGSGLYRAMAHSEISVKMKIEIILDFFFFFFYCFYNVFVQFKLNGFKALIFD